MTPESSIPCATSPLTAPDADERPAGRAKRRAALSEPLRGEKRSGGTARPKREPAPVVVSRRTLPPKRRWCLACDPPREKTGASFAPGDDRCRKCVREGNELQAPKPVSRKRLCIVCGDHRHPSRFERHGGVVAEVCELCATDPDIRVTLRQEAAAAVVLRALRRIRAARLDEASTCPALGVSALQEIAAEALRRVEEART